MSAYAQQVQQYQLQLQQYANQVKNTLAPSRKSGRQRKATMSTVLGTVNMFQNGSQLQGYLNQFQDVNYWLSAPPSAYTYQTAGSVAQKQANDAMVKGIVQQQAQIQADAANSRAIAIAGAIRGRSNEGADGRERVGSPATGAIAANPRSCCLPRAASLGGSERHAGKR